MFKTIALLVTLISSVLVAQACEGGFIVTIGGGNSFVGDVGQQTVITVGAYATDPGPLTLQSYGLAFDVGNNGVGLPAGVSASWFSADFSGSPLNAGTSFEVPTPDANNFDIGVNASTPTLQGADLTLYSAANPLKLFDLIVTPTVPVSNLVISFRPDATSLPGAFDYNYLVGTGVSTLPQSGVSASFSVNAVPEPSSIMLCSLCMGGLAAYRARRRARK